MIHFTTSCQNVQSALLFTLVCCLCALCLNPGSIVCKLNQLQTTNHSCTKKFHKNFCLNLCVVYVHSINLEPGIIESKLHELHSKTSFCPFINYIPFYACYIYICQLPLNPAITDSMLKNYNSSNAKFTKIFVYFYVLFLYNPSQSWNQGSKLDYNFFLLMCLIGFFVYLTVLFHVQSISTLESQRVRLMH